MAEREKMIYCRWKTLTHVHPCPPESKGTAGAKLEEFLGKVRGKGLGVSLLFDQTMQYWNDDKPESEIPTLPTNDSLNYNINELSKLLT